MTTSPSPAMREGANILVNINNNCLKHFLLLYKHFTESADILYRIGILRK